MAKAKPTKGKVEKLAPLTAEEIINAKLEGRTNPDYAAVDQFLAEMGLEL